MAFKYKENGKNNSFSGYLNNMKPHLDAFSSPFMGQKADILKSEYVNGIMPRYTLDQKKKESMIFDACAQIDMLLGLIEIVIVVKLQGTEFDRFEPKMEVANMKSIIKDLRNKWVRPRIKFKNEDVDDYMMNEHLVQIYNLIELLAFKPTDMIEGLNMIFKQFFLPNAEDAEHVNIKK